MPMSPPYRYIILGAGRQGTAAAYDLARFGNPETILLADIELESAQTAAKRVNRLIGKDIARSISLDVSDIPALEKILKGYQVALSAVPYFLNLTITKACIKMGVCLTDMGGHTSVIRDQLALDPEAKESGISIVPDCGMGPGLITTMAAYAMELLDDPQEIFIYDGGLPQNPIPPWNYQATFHLNGLTNEMDGKAFFIRDGKVTPVDSLSDPQDIDFPPLGQLEADVTSGGLSTSPWTFQNRLKTYENRTLRYPGHFEWLRAYKALGLFREEPLQVGEQSIIPRNVFHTLLEPHISADEIQDVCIIRVIGHGIQDSKKATVIIDLIDYYDPKTGFTAMERLTGWHCAIMMGFQARGIIPSGGIPMEIAVAPAEFMKEISKRGIEFSVRWDD